MRSSVVTLSIVLASCSEGPAPPASDPPVAAWDVSGHRIEIVCPMGESECELRADGRALRPISFSSTWRLEHAGPTASGVELLELQHGDGCPAMHHAICLGDDAVRASATFGNCDEVAGTRPISGGGVLVELAGFEEADRAPEVHRIDSTRCEVARVAPPE